MKETMTYYDLLTSIKNGENPASIIYSGDLEKYVWNGAEYIGINNNKSLSLKMIEDYTDNKIVNEIVLGE